MRTLLGTDVTGHPVYTRPAKYSLLVPIYECLTIILTRHVWEWQNFALHQLSAVSGDTISDRQEAAFCSYSGIFRWGNFHNWCMKRSAQLLVLLVTKFHCLFIPMKIINQKNKSINKMSVFIYSSFKILIKAHLIPLSLEYVSCLTISFFKLLQCPKHTQYLWIVFNGLYS